MLPQCTPQSPLVQKMMMEMVAELLGSQSFAETLLGKKGLAVGSLMELSQFQLDLLWLTFFGKRWNVLQCENKVDVIQFYNCMYSSNNEQ